MPLAAGQQATAAAAQRAPSTQRQGRPLLAASPATQALPLQRWGLWRQAPARSAPQGALPPTPAPGSA